MDVTKESGLPSMNGLGPELALNVLNGLNGFDPELAQEHIGQNRKYELL